LVRFAQGRAAYQQRRKKNFPYITLRMSFRIQKEYWHFNKLHVMKKNLKAYLNILFDELKKAGSPLENIMQKGLK
jgi:hypothetical protein